MNIKNKEAFNKMMESLEIQEIKKFFYYEDFYNNWKEKIKYAYNNELLFISNDENAQVYKYKLDNIKIEFDFHIKYILHFFEKAKNDSNLFSKVILKNKNGKLNFSGIDCEYTKFNSNNFFKTDNNPILVTFLPFSYISVVVIDGNHKIHNNIKKNIEEIPAILVNQNLCAVSLSSYFQAIMYLFFIDLNKLIYNIDSCDHIAIKENLEIFNKNILDELDKRLK